MNCEKRTEKTETRTYKREKTKETSGNIQDQEILEENYFDKTNQILSKAYNFINSIKKIKSLKIENFNKKIENLINNSDFIKIQSIFEKPLKELEDLVRPLIEESMSELISSIDETLRGIECLKKTQMSKEFIDLPIGQ